MVEVIPTIDTFKSIPWFHIGSQVWINDGNHDHLHGATILGEPFRIPNAKFLDDKEKKKLLDEIQQISGDKLCFDPSILEDGGIWVVYVQWIECCRKDLVECCRLAGPVFIDGDGTIAERMRSRSRKTSKKPSTLSARPSRKSPNEVRNRLHAQNVALEVDLTTQLDEPPPSRLNKIQNTLANSPHGQDLSINDDYETEYESDSDSFDENLLRAQEKTRKNGNMLNQEKNKNGNQSNEKYQENGNQDNSLDHNIVQNQNKNHKKRKTRKRTRNLTSYQLKRLAMSNLERRHRLASQKASQREKNDKEEKHYTSMFTPGVARDSNSWNYVDFGDSDFSDCSNSETGMKLAHSRDTNQNDSISKIISDRIKTIQGNVEI